MIKATGIALWLFFVLAAPETELPAVSFVHEVPGYAPFYKDKGARAGMLAIRPKMYRDQWARAWRVLDAQPGRYELKLTTLLEYDGESKYQILINGKPVGEFQNPPIEGKEQETLFAHSVKGVNLSPGDTLVVAACAQSNKRIPEQGAPGGFGWSRGRWKSLTIAKAP